MKLETQLHTVFLLIGPSGSGKTYFTENYLVPGLKDKFGERIHPNIQHISSDRIRQDILGNHILTKYDDEMIYVSEQAFDVLFNRLNNVTSYPVNAEFVIVDTTGLSAEFRNKVVQAAKKNLYNIEAIIFDYKDREEYFKHSDNINKRVTYKHIRKLRDGYKEIRAKDFTKIHKVKQKEFWDLKIEITNLDLYKRCLADPHVNEYPIIADIHGCYDQFEELLTKLNFEIKNGNIINLDKEKPNRKIVLAGDIINKGPDSEGIIDLIYSNRDMFVLVKGNHENFVSKHMRGEIKGGPSEEFIKEYFDTCYSITNSITREKFLKLVDDSVPFFKHKNFIVTHVPCKKKYLGKLDKNSYFSQIKHRIKRDDEFESIEEYTKHMEGSLSYIKEEAVRNHPYHIFGHYPLRRWLRIKNKLGIDTGCVHGNKLTAAIINNSWSKPFIVDVKNETTYKETMLPNLWGGRKIREVNLDDLEVEDKIRIRKLAENKVNFISGTMSPSDKNEECLESLDTAFDYYRSKGQKKVMLQPKYMGSRCNIYLHREDLDQCYAVSRNGYKIRSFDDRNLTPLFKKLQKEQFDKMLDEKVLIRIIDSELMPWRAIGAGLIDRQFDLVRKAIESELKLLEENGFEYELGQFIGNEDFQDFLEEVETVSKKDLIKKYGHHNYSTFNNLKDLEWTSIETQARLLETYQHQVKIYGGEGELHFKPFSVLKDIFENGTEINYISNNHENEALFTEVSNDEYLIVNLDNEESIEKAKKWYEKITKNEEMEGVVVKPQYVYVPMVAPFLKVRNSNYLTIVYGYDYKKPSKHERLLKQKSINSKIRTSINEWEIGRNLLNIPYNEISKTNKEYINLCAEMVVEEGREKTIDPRL